MSIAFDPTARYMLVALMLFCIGALMAIIAVFCSHAKKRLFYGTIGLLLLFAALELRMNISWHPAVPIVAVTICFIGIILLFTVPSAVHSTRTIPTWRSPARIWASILLIAITIAIIWLYGA